jgi:23S rRNA (cytosine1962-C5)-methyltransferase
MTNERDNQRGGPTTPKTGPGQYRSGAPGSPGAGQTRPGRAAPPAGAKIDRRKRAGEGYAGARPPFAKPAFAKPAFANSAGGLPGYAGYSKPNPAQATKPAFRLRGEDAQGDDALDSAADAKPQYERQERPKIDYTPAPDAIVVRMKIERRSNHPWVFQKMVEKPAVKPRSGTVVDIIDATDSWVGRGFYNGHSRIALRVLTTNPAEAIDAAYFSRKLDDAVALRREVLNLDAVTDAYRLVHSEGDDLSGLVIDRFGNTLVLEYFSAGMWRQRDVIRKALEAYFPGATHFWFAEEHVGKQESFDCQMPAPPPPVIISEHGLKFHAAPGTGHKTGFFADQRDSRKYLAEFCAGKRVLDLCCNSGGFAVYAKALGRAEEVVAIDIDDVVLATAEQNARLNNAKIRFVQADIFPWLRDAAINGEQFDVVVLDPAKLTRDREQVLTALKKYLDMNKLAMAMVKPGGVFLTCSCTGLVSEEEFLGMLRRAAFFANRTVQILKVTGAGADHPFMAHVPESRYLKAVFCRVF